MLNIPLLTVPNQSLSISANDQIWTVRLKDIGGNIYADITMGDVALVEGQRVVAGQPIIPYAHLAGNGNFVFITDNDEIPNWEHLGVDQQLLYVFPSEWPT